ncbi:MAG: hypothetical protein IPM69_10120 [Ignavibacteria bacterium]|nr:hypothetical protein [Ignavibacteria bacterium]
MLGNLCMSFCITVLYFLSMPSLTAQSQLDISGMALGKAGVAFTRGTDALSSNPANIYTSDTTYVLHWTIMSAGALIGSSVFTIKDINYYFGGDGSVDAYGSWNPRYLSPSERDIFAQKVDNSTIVAQVETMPIGIVLTLPNSGTLGFSIINSLQLQLQFPDKFSQLFNGYAGKERLEISGGQYSALMTSSYGVTYAQNMKISGVNRSYMNYFSIGATLKFIRGSLMQELDPSNSATLTPYIPETWDSTYNWAVNVRYQARFSGSAPQELSIGNFTGFGGETTGVGMGIDFGCTTNLTEPDSSGRQAMIACSLLDYGWISWNTTSKIYTSDARDTIVGVTQVTNSQIDKLKGNAQTGGFQTDLPMRLRFGISVPLRLRLLEMPLTIMAEFTQGLKSIGANTTNPRFGLGMQVGDKGLLWRLGMQAGGIEGLSISAGIGSNWKIVNFDISIGSVRAALGYASARMFNYSAGVNFRLPVSHLL